MQGLLIFLFILYRILTHLWPGRKKNPGWPRAGPSAFLIVATWVMVVGYFLNNLTNDLYVNDAALLFWFLVGCAVSVRGLVDFEPTAASEPAPVPNAGR